MDNEKRMPNAYTDFTADTESSNNAKLEKSCHIANSIANKENELIEKLLENEQLFQDNDTVSKRIKEIKETNK